MEEGPDDEVGECAMKIAMNKEKARSAKPAPANAYRSRAASDGDRSARAARYTSARTLITHTCQSRPKTH